MCKVSDVVSRPPCCDSCNRCHRSYTLFLFRSELSCCKGLEINRLCSTFFSLPRCYIRVDATLVPVLPSSGTKLHSPATRDLFLWSLSRSPPVEVEWQLWGKDLPLLSSPSPLFRVGCSCSQRSCDLLCSGPSAKAPGGDPALCGLLCGKHSGFSSGSLSSVLGSLGRCLPRPQSQPQYFIRNKAGTIHLVCRILIYPSMSSQARRENKGICY